MMQPAEATLRASIAADIGEARAQGLSGIVIDAIVFDEAYEQIEPLKAEDSIRRAGRPPSAWSVSDET